MDSRPSSTSGIAKRIVLLAFSFLPLTEVSAATPDAEKDYQAYLDNLYSIVPDSALEVTRRLSRMNIRLKMVG
jgi:hypothetical protein